MRASTWVYHRLPTLSPILSNAVTEPAQCATQLYGIHNALSPQSTGIDTTAILHRGIPMAIVTMRTVGMLSVTATIYQIAATATLPGGGALSVTATIGLVGAAAPLPGYGELDAAANAMFTVSSALASAGALSAHRHRQYQRPVSLSGQGTFVINAHAIKFAVHVAPRSHGRLAATGKIAEFVLPTTASGRGALSAAAHAV